MHKFHRQHFTEFILTTEIQFKESNIFNLIYTNSGCKNGSSVERVSTGIQVDGAGGNASQEDVKPEVPNFSYSAQTHITKHNSVKNNSQPNIDPTSLTSDTPFSASQFVDVSSDVDKKEAYNTHKKAQLSKVGESDVASNLKGNNVSRNATDIPAKHCEIVSTHDDIEKGEPTSIVNVMMVTKIPICLHNTKSLSKVCNKTNKTQGELTENEVKVNEQDGDNNPKQSKRDIVAQPSPPISDTAGEHAELTDSSISEIYETEYANMKQKIAIW